MGTHCCNELTSSKPDRLDVQLTATLVALGGLLVGWLAPVAGLAEATLPALLVAYIAAGSDASVRAVKAMARKEVDVDALMILAALGAAAVGHWLEGAVLLFLFSLGNTLETYAFRRTRTSIQSLVELRPEEALLVSEGPPRSTPLADLEPGNVVRVLPGDRIPVDGTVVLGASSVDESTLTGESIPVQKEVGSAVFAGTLNGAGSIDLQMTRPADDTALERIIRLVEEARDAKAPTQSWIEDVEGRYAVAVIVAAILAILIPWLGFGEPFDDAFYRAMTLLVVASPCALVISIPATIVSAVSNGARHGILFKGGAHLDALADVHSFALDKTGTVTVGRPEVIEIRTAEQTPDSVHRLLRLAAAAESRSEHHLGKAISIAATERRIPIPEPSTFASTTGMGVQARVEGFDVAVGRQTWVEEQTGSAVAAPAPSEHTVGATEVHVAVDGRWSGVISIRDRARDYARDAIEELRALDVTQVVMLTGDGEAAAQAIAEEVGIDTVHASLRPEGKTVLLRDLQRHGPVAMVGDGVNDAPALATADVGVAMGGAGTDVALETADVVIMGEDLRSLARAIRLSRRTRRIVRQNLAFSVAMMGLLVIAALAGWIGLTAGVLGHEGSTIVVVANGLRLLRDPRRL